MIVSSTDMSVPQTIPLAAKIPDRRKKKTNYSCSNPKDRKKTNFMLQQHKDIFLTASTKKTIKGLAMGGHPVKLGNKVRFEK